MPRGGRAGQPGPGRRLHQGRAVHHLAILRPARPGLRGPPRAPVDSGSPRSSRRRSAASRPTNRRPAWSATRRSTRQGTVPGPGSIWPRGLLRGLPRPGPGLAGRPPLPAWRKDPAARGRDGIVDLSDAAARAGTCVELPRRRPVPGDGRQPRPDRRRPSPAQLRVLGLPGEAYPKHWREKPADRRVEARRLGRRPGRHRPGRAQAPGRPGRDSRRRRSPTRPPGSPPGPSCPSRNASPATTARQAELDPRPGAVRRQAGPAPLGDLDLGDAPRTREGQPGLEARRPGSPWADLRAEMARRSPTPDRSPSLARKWSRADRRLARGPKRRRADRREGRGDDERLAAGLAGSAGELGPAGPADDGDRGHDPGRQGLGVAESR